MTTKVAINGFGRIGRLVLRALTERSNFPIQVVAINDLSSVEGNAHMFKYDSVHGTYPREVTTTDSTMDVGFGPIKIFKEPDPEKLPWGELGVDMVLECSGYFTERDKAAKHIKAGAKRVLISAPANDADLTVVYGVNHSKITPEQTILSNASCTTNCLAPVAAVLHEAIGIEHGFMTTIHAYTGDQRLVDTYHTDLRRSRAAALSMIPTSTGAARAVGLVLPDLKGKIDGTAIRVPTPNVSVVDFKFTAKRATNQDEINNAIKHAAGDKLKGILSTVNAPLVSIDFNHNSSSSIFDLTQTQVIDGKFCRVLSWYDNEWGFANRMLDTARHIANINSEQKGQRAEVG
jgi:glyceraldehyde 3-phosphate dehydrogenase